MTAADRLFVETAVADAGDRFVLDDSFRLRERARHAAEAFVKTTKDDANGDDDPKEDGRALSQIRSLESLAVSARSVADVLDHVKRQSGRRTKAGDMWRTTTGGGEPFGGALLADLDRVLEAANAALAEREDAGPGLARRLRLGFVRRYVLALVAEYLYRSGQ